MPKTHIWQLRAVLYVAAPFMAITGLFITESPLLAALGGIVGFLAHLALADIRQTREDTTDTERTDRP